MSFDLAVWHTPSHLTDEEARQLHADLGESRIDCVSPHPSIDDFYADLTARYPELDTVSDELIDDSNFCSWSCALERSPGHIRMACVWSQAQAVSQFVWGLAAKHRLALFDPQEGRVHYPGGKGR
jgi:hypothetical protein